MPRVCDCCGATDTSASGRLACDCLQIPGTALGVLSDRCPVATCRRCPVHCPCQPKARAIYAAKAARREALLRYGDGWAMFVAKAAGEREKA